MRTIDHVQATGRLYQLRLRVECILLVIYDWVCGFHSEGIYKNGGVFKLQRHHLKQLYLMLIHVNPPPHTRTKHALS
jgi:hypothetical protein